MLGSLPLNALIAFEAAARHLSFSKAAAELNVTPAAISQQIRSLEDSLGIQLFHRLTRGLALTPAAEAGLPALREGFGRVREGVGRMRGESREDSLNVWAAPSFTAKWLVPRLPRFTAAHPDISIRLTATAELMDYAGTTALPASALREHDIDIAVRFGMGNYPGCKVEKLMSATAVPLCSPALRDDGARPLERPEDLAHVTLLHDDTPYEGRLDWPRWLEAAGVEDVNSSRGLHFNHVAIALEAAADSQGVVLSLLELAERDIAAGRLVAPFDLRLPLDQAYYVINLEDAPNAENIDAFCSWLLAEAGGRVQAAVPRALSQASQSER